jgi:hypothetical protein
MEITIAKANDAAQKVSEHESLFGVSYLEEFGLEGDPKLTHFFLRR